MCDQSRRGFVRWSVGVLALGGALAAQPSSAQTPVGGKVWTCPPCGCPEDGKPHAEAGACPGCGMAMVEKAPDAPAPKAPPAPAPQ